ncbi:MAG: OmpA family protein [Acetobacteraceae bacterium]|nr:OmpA family protein [Acetobacteraceae bacterium]
MSLRKALLTATIGAALPLAAATVPAQAQPVTGLYIAGGVGANLRQSTDVDTGIGTVGTADWQAGVAGVLSLGWGFGNGLRAEIEGGYRWNHLDKAGIAPGLAAPFSGALVQYRGSQRTVSVMANVLYDFAFLNSPVTPYVGAGVGWAWIDNHKLRATSNVFGLRFESDDWDNRFAYQAIAGLAFNLPVPGLAVTAEYRFMGTLSPEHTGRVRNLALPGAPVVASGKVETDNFNHSIMLGVRYAFNAPRPPAPQPQPQPPAVQARTFLVFFDWDRADLTARARQIVAEAAQASRSQQTTRIDVAGHADRSGSAQYNQRLSQRRADNVAAELVRNGVPREAIVVTAYGETRPLVPTADGVREPQNRRVEIVLH